MEWMTSLMIVGGMLAIILIALGIRYISSPSDLDQKNVTKEVVPPSTTTLEQPSVTMVTTKVLEQPSVVTAPTAHVDACEPSTPKPKKKVKPKKDPRLSVEAPVSIPVTLSEREVRVNAVVKAYLDLIEANKASEIPALIRAKIGALQSEDEAREAIALITAAQNNNNPLNGQKEAIERIGVLTFFQRIRLREAMLGKVEEVIKELSGK